MCETIQQESSITIWWSAAFVHDTTFVRVSIFMISIFGHVSTALRPRPHGKLSLNTALIKHIDKVFPLLSLCDDPSQMIWSFSVKL